MGFVPAGDGARSFFRSDGATNIRAEVRVRRDGVLSAARNYVEIYSDAGELRWLRRVAPTDALLITASDEDWNAREEERAATYVAEGYPSTVLDFLPALELHPGML